MLPTTVEDVMEQLGLTKMPANRRLNMLLNAGLISWQKGTAQIEKGPLTAQFLESVKQVKKYITAHSTGVLLEDLVRESMRSGKIR